MSGKVRDRSTFTPFFGGRGMRITSTGNAHAKEEDLAFFDVKRQKWIYDYIGSDGTYSVMEGTPAGNKINFVQVYPSPGPTLVVTNISSRKFTEVLTIGNKIVESEVCSKD